MVNLGSVGRLAHRVYSSSLYLSALPCRLPKGVEMARPFEKRILLYATSPKAMEALRGRIGVRGYTLNRLGERDWSVTLGKDYLRGISVEIFETWNREPLELTARLYKDVIGHVGMVSDKFYYTPGNMDFGPEHIVGMVLFIKHFTTLDSKAFEAALGQARTNTEVINIVANFIDKASEADA